MRSLILRILTTTLKALSRATIRRYKPTIVGVTGNVGKTSAKEAIRTVLEHEHNVRASSKNFNNELGLPLVILGDWKETGGAWFWIRVVLTGLRGLLIPSRSYPDVLVLEYGVDKPGDMTYLLDIARPDVGVVTAIGDIPVHVEFFSGKEAVAKEKGKLIHRLPASGTAILNADDMTVREMEALTRAQVRTFGFSEDTDMRIEHFEPMFQDARTGVSFKLQYEGAVVPVRIDNVLGKAQGYAAAIAASVGLIFDMNLVTIAEALEEYHAPAGRLRVLLGIKRSLIIDDTYNASPLATEAALHALESVPDRRKIAVLGDMLEIGKYTTEAHESIGALAAGIADILVTIGMRARFIAEGAKQAGMSEQQIMSFEQVGEAGLAVQDIMKEGDVVLVKGSQGVRLEKIVKEIMDDPESASKLLVRQNKAWLTKKGVYE